MRKSSFISRKNQPTIVSVVGKSNSGKTTLLERLIPELKRRGYTVAAIKHHAHSDFDVDRPGKDSWRHAQAGAESIALVSREKMFLVRRTEKEMPLEAAVAMLGDVDIVLTEGYSMAFMPKIKVVRDDTDGVPCHSGREMRETVALVTDLPLEVKGIPLFGPDEVSRLTDLLERRFLKSGKLMDIGPSRVLKPRSETP